MMRGKHLQFETLLRCIWKKKHYIYLYIVSRRLLISTGKLLNIYSMVSHLEPSFPYHSGIFLREVHYIVMNSCTSSSVIYLRIADMSVHIMESDGPNCERFDYIPPLLLLKGGRIECCEILCR